MDVNFVLIGYNGPTRPLKVTRGPVRELVLIYLAMGRVPANGFSYLMNLNK